MDLVAGTLILRPYVFGFVAAFVVAGVLDLGWRRTLLFGATICPLAWIAEFSSTRVGVPFGLYHYTQLTRGHELYVANVPLMDSLSFTFLAYAAFSLARVALRERSVDRGRLALLAGLLMMLLDVVIDPAAVRGNRWFLGHVFYYPDGGSYFGVPLTNFFGWWLVGTVGVGTYLGLAGASGRRPGPGVAVYYGVLAFNFAVTAWIAEWQLLAAGLLIHIALVLVLIHAVVAVPLVMLARSALRAPALPAQPWSGGRHRKGGEFPLRGKI